MSVAHTRGPAYIAARATCTHPDSTHTRTRALPASIVRPSAPHPLTQHPRLADPSPQEPPSKHSASTMADTATPNLMTLEPDNQLVFGRWLLWGCLCKQCARTLSTSHRLPPLTRPSPILHHRSADLELQGWREHGGAQADQQQRRSHPDALQDQDHSPEEVLCATQLGCR